MNINYGGLMKNLINQHTYIKCTPDSGGESALFDLVVLDVGDQVLEGFVFIDNNKDLKNKVK